MATFSLTSAELSGTNKFNIKGTLGGLRTEDEKRIYVIMYVLLPYNGSKVSDLTVILEPLCVIVGKVGETEIRTGEMAGPREMEVKHFVNIPGIETRVTAIRDFVRASASPRVMLRATLFEHGFLKDGVSVETDVTRFFR